MRRDLAGYRFGRLVVVEPAEDLGQRTRWACRCDCGRTSIVNTSVLVVGHARSCGCLRREATAARNRARAVAP